jgi:integrase
MGLKKRGGRWWYRFQYKGREVCKTTGLAASERNRSSAEAIEAQARLTLLTTGLLPQAIRPEPFDLAASSFLAWCKDVEYRSKPSTAARIKTSFASLVELFGSRWVSSIDVPAVEDYKTVRLRVHQVRDVTLRHDLHSLSVFFKRWAIPRRLATSNPVAQVSIPSDIDAHREHILSPEEEEAYFAVARGTLHDVAKLILLTGCRPEEAVALRQDDVDLKGGVIHIRGGKSRAARRSLPLVDEALWILRRRLGKKSVWVFPSPVKAGAHITKLNKQHDLACLDAQLSFVLYDLRHTFATRLVTEAGVDVVTLAKILGHSNLRTVMRYVHPTDEAAKSAMEKYQALIAERRAPVKTGTAGT